MRDPDLIRAWFLCLAGGIFAAAEGNPVVLLTPVFMLLAVWQTGVYIRTTGRRSVWAMPLVLVVALIASSCTAIIGSLAAQVWRNVCRGFAPFASFGDDGTRLAILVAFVCAVLFFCTWFATKSTAASTRLCVALMSPALVLCGVQVVWAI